MAKQRKTTKNENSETTKRYSSHSINFNNTIVTITNLKGEVIPGRQVVVGLKALVNQRRLLLRQPLKQRRVNQWIKD
jgi:hypothetical protein